MIGLSHKAPLVYVVYVRVWWDGGVTVGKSNLAVVDVLCM